MRDGQFGCRRGFGVRCIKDDNAAFGGGRHVNVIDTDAGSADHLKRLCCSDDQARHARFGAYNESVVTCNLCLKPGFIEPGCDIDAKVTSVQEQLSAVLMDRVRNQHTVSLIHSPASRYPKRSTGPTIGAKTGPSGSARPVL